ncbi:putative MFS family arabinose efflux permease [Melghirimyces profundicolus]|uniref:Putative MFS family arabinose efflux permease n=1 Tax=Melghirimyces profundicolus TaxID=1242148 RepID=A0A2T6C8P3_9BACL|nr:MFS transporter [Melghirimyces profundicolus]PTX64688.1 putative MFS family arabinose efflux permease [Melghirimyces profundicolus]
MNPGMEQRRNFRVLWGVQFISTAGLTVVVPLLPFYLETLGVFGEENRWWTGLSLSAPALTLILASPFWGKIGDRWGRKWMVVRAVFGLCLSMLLMGMAQTPWLFLLFRLMQGAFGGVVDAAAAFAGSDAPPDKRGRTLGSFQGATAAGSLAGPLLGGLLADGYGYRVLFFLMAALTGISGLWAAKALTEPRTGIERKRKPVPLRQVFAGLWGSRSTRSLILAGFLAKAGVFGLVVVFAPLVRDLSGSPAYAATWVGGLQAVTWGATFLGGSWWGKRNDRSSPERNFFFASLACGVCVGLQTAVHHPLWLLPLRLVQGFCFSALLPSVFLKVTRSSPEEVRGSAIGVTNSFLVLGQIMGSFSAALISGWLSPDAAFLFLGGFFLTGALLMVRLPRHTLSRSPGLPPLGMEQAAGGVNRER